MATGSSSPNFQSLPAPPGGQAVWWFECDSYLLLYPLCPSVPIQPDGKSCAPVSEDALLPFRNGKNCLNKNKDVHKYTYIYVYNKRKYIYFFSCIHITVNFSTSQTYVWTTSNISLSTLFFLIHFQKGTIISFPFPIQPVYLSHRFPCDQDYLSEDFPTKSATCSHLDTQAIPQKKTVLYVV